MIIQNLRTRRIKNKLMTRVLAELIQIEVKTHQEGVNSKRKIILSLKINKLKQRIVKENKKRKALHIKREEKEVVVEVNNDKICKLKC